MVVLFGVVPRAVGLNFGCLGAPAGYPPLQSTSKSCPSAVSVTVVTTVPLKAEVTLHGSPPLILHCQFFYTEIDQLSAFQ